MAVTAPIWKDTNYAVSSANSPYTYSIALKTGNQITAGTQVTDEVITVFNGKAWVRPGQGYLYINVSKIAQDYLYSDMPDLNNITVTTTYEHKYAYRQFYLLSSAGTTAQTFNFLLDWSYDNTGVTTNMNMSRPVNGHGCSGMLFMNTVFNSSQKVVTTISISPGSSYDGTHCGTHAIYYLNRYGGWDSFLIEGNVQKSDNYTKYNISKPYSTQSQEFEKSTYHNEINERYVLYTGWMSDAESERLARNLFSTNMAYLHDLVNDKIFPIVITDTQATYKTFKNLGKKKVNYAINVEASQSKHNIG